jgi:hypothetical protein
MTFAICCFLNGNGVCANGSDLQPSGMTLARWFAYQVLGLEGIWIAQG